MIRKPLCEGPKEACGVFGVFGLEDASKLTYFGLYALQHRGQESAGIVSSDGRSIHEHRGMGLVHDIFNEQILSGLHGHISVGHVRYSTTGSSILKNAQPFIVSHGGEFFAIAHNGNLVNAGEIRRDLERKGSIFQTTMDSETIVHLLIQNIKQGMKEALVSALSRVEGAYSCVLMTRKELIAFRDPNGFRPLCIGLLDGGYIVASETCALDLVEAAFLREVNPGEVLIINEHGLQSFGPVKNSRKTFCIFEYIYFSRPDSSIFGQNVYKVRKRLGKRMALECKVRADFAMPLPDSGNYAAVGFCQESGIPLEMGIIRNHYVGRTFIEPAQTMRDFGVRVKLNPVKELLNRKRVIVIEDSIIRGTTSKMRIKALRDAGAREIHMVVSCPPHRYPCYYGIDFSDRGELIACNHSVEEIMDFIGLDSLCYLSLSGMLQAVGPNKNNFCLACFNGDYPIEPKKGLSKLYLESC